MHRGKQARREIAKLQDKAGKPPVANKDEVEESAEDAFPDDSEAEAAAVQIQRMHRGKQARREIAKLQDKAGKPPVANKDEVEESAEDAFPDDSEAEAAAVQIQVFIGGNRPVGRLQSYKIRLASLLSLTRMTLKSPLRMLSQMIPRQRLLQCRSSVCIGGNRHGGRLQSCKIRQASLPSLTRTKLKVTRRMLS